MPTIDFEGNQQTNTNPGGDGGNNPNPNPVDKPDVTNLHGDDVTDLDKNKPDNNNNPGDDGNGNDNGNRDDNNVNDLEAGTEVEFEGVVYKVDDKGNLINDKGEIFKEAKDVKQFLEDNGFTDNAEETEISIDSIKEAIGVDIKDESGKIIEFTNDPAGIKAYIDAVRELQAKEISDGAVNKLFTDNPILKQFVDYLKITGSPKGFGEIPDRSGIQLDKDNEAQLEAIIKMAANEFGNKSLDDNYIKYLKSTGALYDVAKVQLEALVAHDKEIREDIEHKAEEARKAEEADIENYWKSVSTAIKERRIGGYLLPETIVKEVNGQKITYKLDDFYDYVAKPTQSDANGNRMTGYSKDLNELSDKELLERELLDAWLMWTKGSYKDLVDMAIKEDGVRRLVARSKEQRTKNHVKVTKPAQSGKDTKLVFE